MRGLAMLLLLTGAFSAHAAPQCQGSAVPQPLAARPTLLVPVVAGFAIANPQLGSQRGVLATDFDQSQSVDNVLWRLQMEGCESVTAAGQASVVNATTYVKQTEFDNTPYRFNMTQSGKRMTADDFDAWLKANGYSAGRRVDPAAAPAVEAAATPPEQ